MKLAMPQEIEVWYILPAIRRAFVDILVQELHLSQKETAELLNLTESAVSQYLAQKRGTDVHFQEVVVNHIRKAAKRIMNKETSVIPEMVHISKLPEVQSHICDIHRKEQTGLAHCDVCFTGLVTPK